MIHFCKSLIMLGCVLIAIGSASYADESKGPTTPAFPGAEGFGAYAKGGRGGQVLFVTNLEDYIPKKEKAVPGSLRFACDAKGPRTVIFQISGTIALKAPLIIDEPCLTLAGQTAPGGGICLKNHQTVIRTHDVIVRHIRFRPGDEMKIEVDALWLAGAHNVIIDHCSASWAIDETLSVTKESKDVTIQWCLIAESLHNSHHHKGNHGYGSIIGGDGVSFHHNIFAHHRSRNPRVGGSEASPGGIVDLRNNVIYNWGDRAGYNGTEHVRMNYVGNYLKPGPSTTDKRIAFSIGGDATRMYAFNNLIIGVDAQAGDAWKLIRSKASAITINQVKVPFDVSPVFTQQPEQAYVAVMTNCGATLPQRDAVDQRIITSITDDTGRHIDSQRDVGGWPELKTRKSPADQDHDGLPDAWEMSHRLNPKRSNHNDDPDDDGYTNIEEFLNGTNPNKRETAAAPNP